MTFLSRGAAAAGGGVLTAASACSYRNLATEHEALMQKYLHLLQIVETEKTVAKQLRQQIEDGEIEIERLKAEVKSPASPRGCNAAPQGGPWAVGGQGGSPPRQGPGDVAAGVFRLVLRTSGWRLLPQRGARASPSVEFYLAEPCSGPCAGLSLAPGPRTQPRLCRPGTARVRGSVWPLAPGHGRGREGLTPAASAGERAGEGVPWAQE